MSSADQTFGLLLRHAIPMVMAAPGSLSIKRINLRGVVRSGPSRARICFSDDELMDQGWGYEFDLSSDNAGLDVDAAIDWVRLAAASGAPKRCDGAEDSHRNRIIRAEDAGFGEAAQAASRHDQNLFSILSILVHGGGFPWFEDTYSSAGFMLLKGRRCRLYVRTPSRTESYGLDLPVADPSGKVAAGMGSTFPQQLASLLRTDTLSAQPAVNEMDDYASHLYDMSEWV